ncbi:Actin-like protein arp9 (SWI/SNF complex component arp9), partial [Lobulomyces angularis]
VFNTCLAKENQTQTFIFGQDLKNIPESEKNWPINQGIVQDWDSLCEIWKHILVHKFNVIRMRNDKPILVMIPSYWSKTDIERLTQIMFEYLNVPGLYIAEQPLMAVYGIGAVTGVVIDIGHETTDITAVLDTTINYYSRQTILIGGRHVEEYLLELLKKDEKFLKEYGKQPDINLARAIKESSICEVFPSLEIVKSRLGQNEIRKEFEYDNIK